MEKISGLVNIGNSCYFNSLVQCLLSCPSFVSYCQQNMNINQVCRCFVEINGGNPTSTSKLLQLITNKTKYNLRYGQQEDAHEAFLCIMDLIGEEINNIFCVRHIITLKCNKCERVLKKSDNPVELYLEQAIDADFNILYTSQGLSDYKCDKCKTVGQCVEVRQLCRISNTCIVLVKNYAKKTEIPRVPQSFSVPGKDGGKLVYNMCGIIDHFGSQSGGHYIAKIKRKDNMAIANDSVITPVSSIDVSPNSYVIFYELKTS